MQKEQNALFSECNLTEIKEILEKDPLLIKRQKKYHYDSGLNKKWCRHTDSNRGPTDYKSVALPTELCRHTFWKALYMIQI